MKSLIEELKVSLIQDDSDVNRKKWAKYIIENNIALRDLTELLNAERPIANRFIWMVGDICELEPKVVSPAIAYFFSQRDNTQITNFNRSLAKMFWLSGIPEEIAGEATSEMFNWLADPNAIVSIKNYSLLALCNLTSKYEELKIELKFVIEDQLQKNSIAFEKCAKKVMEKIG